MSSSQETGAGVDSIMDQALSSIGDAGTSVQQQASSADDLDFQVGVATPSPAGTSVSSGNADEDDIFDQLMPVEQLPVDTVTSNTSQPLSAFDELFGEAPVVSQSRVAPQDAMSIEDVSTQIMQSNGASSSNQDAMDDLLNYPSATGSDLDDLLDLSAVVSDHSGTAGKQSVDSAPEDGVSPVTSTVDFDDLLGPDALPAVVSSQSDENFYAPKSTDLDDMFDPEPAKTPLVTAAFESEPEPEVDSIVSEGGGADFFGETIEPFAAVVKTNDDDMNVVDSHDSHLEPGAGAAGDLLDDLLNDTPASARGDLLDDLLTTSPTVNEGIKEAELPEDDPLDQWSRGLPDDEQLDDILTDGDLDAEMASGPASKGQNDLNDFMSMGGGEPSHEDVLDSLPTHAASEDLSVLLDKIAPSGGPMQARRHTSPVDDSLMPLSSVLSMTASDVSVETVEKASGSAFVSPEKAESAASADESVVTSGKKSSLKRIIASVLGLSLMGGVGFGAWFVTQNYDIFSLLKQTVPELSSQSEAEIAERPDVLEHQQDTGRREPSQPTSADPREIEQLRAEVAGLSEKLTLVLSSKDSGPTDANSSMMELIQKYDAIMGAQQKLIQEQARYAELSEQMRVQLETYETNMLSRFEKVVGLTSKVASQNAEQAQSIKDAVLREAIAAINAKAGGADNGKMAVLQKEIVDAKAKIEQLSQTVVAQRQVQTVLESEIQYIKEAQPLSRRGTKQTPAVKSTSQVSGAKVVVDTEPESPFPDAGNDELVLVGVQSKKGGVFDIYVEPSDPNDMTGVVPYLFGPNQSSVIPGYGRILSVNKVEGAQSLVPYVVVTEMGEIRGKR